MSRRHRIAFAAALAASCVAAQAQEASPPVDATVLAAALPSALEAVYEKPQGFGTAPFTPVVVWADGLAVPATLRVFDTPVTLRSRTQARDEQRAWFVYLGSATQTAEGLQVRYTKPYNGQGGTVTLKLEDGGWKAVGNAKMHSSSGARAFYGELYDGVKCRDGCEMALRWNGLIDAMDAIRTRRERKSDADLSKNCPGDSFPEVAAYRQMKALLAPK